MQNTKKTKQNINKEYDHQIQRQLINIQWKLQVFVIISMSSNFLQRFKGKTQTLSKQGVHNILGSKNIAPVQPPVPINRQQNNSVNKAKSSLGQNANSNTPNITQQAKNKTAKNSVQPPGNKATKSENPFLIANPFYLDEEQRQKEQLQRKQRQRIQQQTKKALQAQNAQKDPKQITKTSNYSKSVQKKNTQTNKEWVKLGGLGANIGGDQWLQKKKKQQKMQEFAGQVKSINSQKIKPRPEIPKPRQKQPNTRQKALEYSKNVPKPVLKKQKEQQQIQQMAELKPKQRQSEGLTELQIYQMKHQQLKKMVHNQY